MLVYKLPDGEIFNQFTLLLTDELIEKGVVVVADIVNVFDAGAVPPTVPENEREVTLIDRYASPRSVAPVQTTMAAESNAARILGSFILFPLVSRTPQESPSAARLRPF